MFGYSLVYIALVQEPDYEVSGSSTGVVTQGIMRGRGRVEGNALACVGGFVGGRGASVGLISPSNVGSVEGKASVTVGGGVGGHRSNVGVVSPNNAGGHGKVEGKATVTVGGYVGGQGTSVGVVPPIIMGGQGKVSVSMGGNVGGHVEGKASVSVGGRGLNGASGGTAVVTGSLRRPVRERLGSMVHSDDNKAETKKVSGHIFILTCHVFNFRCL